jgi:hypothetical protein
MAMKHFQVFSDLDRVHIRMEKTDGSNYDFYVKPDAALVFARAISRAARTMKKPYRLFPPTMTERDV